MSGDPTLLTGEEIVWRGRPRTGLLLQSSDWFLVPFSLSWSAIAIAATINLGSQPALLERLFLLPFQIIAIYLLVGRFFWDEYARRRLRYFVTNKRVIIMREGSAPAMSCDIERLPVVIMEERADGSGSIRFTTMNQSGSPSPYDAPQFLLIDNVRNVCDIIMKHAHLNAAPLAEGQK